MCSGLGSGILQAGGHAATVRGIRAVTLPGSMLSQLPVGFHEEISRGQVAPRIWCPEGTLGIGNNMWDESSAWIWLLKP